MILIIYWRVTNIAGALLDWPVEQVVSRGRQAVAQVLDEDAEYLRNRRRDVYRRIAAES